MKRKSRKKITDILEVIAWLDEKRWNEPNVSFMVRDLNNPIFRTLTWQQKILVHWLCYITDRMRPFEQVWGVGGQVFSELVREYSKATVKTESDVLELFSRDRGFMKKPEKRKKIDKFVSREKNNVEYAVRFQADLYSIAQTLVVLLEPQKNLIKFISKHSKLWANKPNSIVRMAFLLYRLSYNIPEARELKTFKSLGGGNEEILLKRLKGYSIEEGFNREFRRWNISKKFYYKRLWAALRDYIKLDDFSKYFLPHFSLTKNWHTLFQLECPGDVWNKRFARGLLKPLLEKEQADGNKVFLKSSASKTMRRMFDWLNVKSNYYPEQFDVSFNFAPNMCENRFCDLCPFGENGSIEICLEGKGKGKICPVALFTCGYRSPCDPDGCPIVQKIGKGSCTQPHKIQ